MALQIAIEKSFVEIWTNQTLPKIADDVSILNNEMALKLTLRYNKERLTRVDYFAADYRSISIL